jgi:DNA relaxase NicK
MSKSNNHSTKYEIVSCGVDWITATTTGGNPSKEFDALGKSILERDMDMNREVRSSMRLGFIGYESEHFFIGHRGRERMIQASSSRADALATDIIKSASNVSRVDAQVTVFTDNDKPRLALHGYSSLTQSPSPKGRKSRLTLIQSQPEGDALLIGSRRSDYYARLYDKGVESQTAEARTLWRYEVEAKRGRAFALARALLNCDDLKTLCASFVHSWFARKGLEPFYEPKGVGQISLFHIDRRDSDALRWFRSTVSKAIRKAANRYGWPSVLEALELDASLNEGRKEIEK